MSMVIEVNRTYKYRLYYSKQDFRLHDSINVAGIIWNHITALRKRYYRRFGKHLNSGLLQEHISHLRMRTMRFAYWRSKLGSQSVQDICQRHDKAYERFFSKEAGLPRFKKVKKYSSFTLKQSGWKLGEDSHQRGGKKYPKWTGNITVLGEVYKFVKHRPMGGTIKTVTIKRDAAGRLWVCFSVIEKIEIGEETSAGKIGGFDFGLKTFLVNDAGQFITMPQFFKQDLPRMRQIQKQVSKKVKGSENQQQGKYHLARRHIRITDKRRDFHVQLAHLLFDQYDTLVFEELNLEGMKRLWGRKVSDLGFAQFIKIVRWMAVKRGKRVVIIDRWERTTGKCSGCGHEQKLTLKDRTFSCEKCSLVIDRDHNAAKNILEAGHRLILSQSVEARAKRGIRR